MSVEFPDIQPFLIALKQRSEYDFSNYSINSLNRRLMKIMNDFRVSYPELLEKVKFDKNFREEVVKKITVNTTDFFRDIDLWHYIMEEVLPGFTSGNRISVWHPGCSTGQEVYSMMIILNELGLLERTDIFGSDLNTDVLEIARQGRYKYFFNKEYVSNFDKVINHNESRKKVSFEKYFRINEAKDLIIMNDFLKTKPVYRKMDLVKDENPFKQKFDIIVCRNVIIYFNHELQNKVLNLFYNNLNDNGCLVLGMHESIVGTYASRFVKKDKVYFKKSSAH
jgi:chemotaxis protein methyltransferase CheR